jgi:hypothetical protein
MHADFGKTFCLSLEQHPRTLDLAAFLKTGNIEYWEVACCRI